MTKFFGGVAAGLFLGVLAVEVLKRSHPKLLEKVQDKAWQAANEFGDYVRPEPLETRRD